MFNNKSELRVGTSNSTSNRGHKFYSDGVNITIICLCCFTLMVGVTGNALVCLFLGRKNIRKKTDTFLISLGLADLLASFTGSFDSIVTYSFKYTGWQLTGTSDKAFEVVTVATLAISSWTLTAIACDRYWAITRPFESYKITDKIRVAISFLIWMTATVSTAIFMFSEKVGLEGNSLLICIAVMVFLAWVLPMSSIITLYIMCIKKLRSGSLNNPSDSTNRRNKENNRVIKMFIVVTTTFFASIFPAAIVSFVFLNNTEGGVVYLIREFTRILMIAGCVVNPFIYARMHKEIHGALVRVWQRIGGCQEDYIEGESGQARYIGSYQLTGIHSIP